MRIARLVVYAFLGLASTGCQNCTGEAQDQPSHKQDGPRLVVPRARLAHPELFRTDAAAEPSVSAAPSGTPAPAASP